MVHTATLKRARTVGERVRLIADSVGGPEKIGTKEVESILERAGLKSGRSTVSKALNEYRREAGFVETQDEPQTPEVPALAEEVKSPGEPVEAPAKAEPTMTPPEAVELPKATVVALVEEAKPTQTRRWLSVLAAGVVAIVAAVASFSHMQEVALIAGQSEFISYLLPLSVDGLIVVGSVALVDGATRKGIAWFAFAFGVVASLAANVLSADPNILSRSVAAWPALALLLTVEVLLQRRR